MPKHVRRCILMFTLTACDDPQATDPDPANPADSADPADPDDDWVWDDGTDPPDAGTPTTKRVLVDPGETDDAELINTLTVGHSEGSADRRVVMRLGPGDLPSLQPGDRLIVPAEVQVTTRCDVGQSAPGCDYNPTVAAQLILTGSSGDKDPGGPESAALSAVQTLTCTQAEHHCLFTFQRDHTNATLQNALDLPCVAADSCHVNLVMWAWHPDARAGGLDKLLIGENEGDYLANGIARGDKARLMAVRERDLTAVDRPRSETTGGGTKDIPTTTAPTIVYSHRLKQGDLVAGEQYLVEAKVVVDVSSRARFSTRMFITKDPDAEEPNPPAQIFPGSIGEHNGTNCTPGTSPCEIRKVAVFRVTDDLAGPIHVNLVAVSAVPGGGTAKVSVRRGDGFLRSTRYRAALKD